MPHPYFRYSAGALVGSLLAASVTFPAYAGGTDTYFEGLGRLSLADLLLGILALMALVVGMIALAVSAGHYAMNYNRAAAERVCYALGAAYTVSAASHNRLPTLAITTLALGTGALVYCAWPRLRRNK